MSEFQLSWGNEEPVPALNEIVPFVPEVLVPEVINPPAVGSEVGIVVDPESPTVSSINAEIAKLEREFASVRLTLDPHKNEQKSILDHERDLKLAFEKTLIELREAQANLAIAIAEISARLNGITKEIDFKKGLLAQLLKKEAEARQLAVLLVDLNEMLSTFEAWQMARDYQKEDTLFALEAFRSGKNGILNANDMGLGKTYESVILMKLLEAEWMRLYGRMPSILWLTKKSLVKSTLKEFHRWDKTRMMFPLLEANAAARSSMFQFIVRDMQALCVTNYEVLNTTPEVREYEWDLVFIDECHRLKGGANLNGQTKIFKNAKALCQKARFVVMLSGTPMVNHPREMWAYLHVFDPDRFDSLRRFEQIFSVQDVLTGEYKLNADKLLKQALKGQVIRRRLDEVGIQMPEHNHIYRYLEMTPAQQELADMMSESFFIWLNKEAEEKKMISATAIIAQLMRLRQINVWPPSIKIADDDNPKIKHAVNVHESVKINEAMDIIEELTDADEQVVLACCFNEPMWEIQRRCADRNISCDVVMGDNSKDMEKFEARFQNREVQVLCVNMMMGEGLNLHKDESKWIGGASNLIMMDLWWSPAKNEQMERRIRRPGIVQATAIHILHNEGSVDSLIAAIVEDKASQFANIMESKELRPAAEWMEIMQAHLKPKGEIES